MTLVGQIAFTMPFLILLQGSPWAFAASSVTLAVIGIASSYVLARRVLPSPRAAFAVLVVILFPGFVLLGNDVHDGRPGLRGGDALPGGRRGRPEPDSGEPPSALARRLAGHRSAGHSASGSSPWRRRSRSSSLR